MMQMNNQANTKNKQQITVILKQTIQAKTTKMRKKQCHPAQQNGQETKCNDYDGRKQTTTKKLRSIWKTHRKKRKKE
eukprot:2892412-Ditylum_brightwellii.AAC.2